MKIQQWRDEMELLLNRKLLPPQPSNLIDAVEKQYGGDLPEDVKAFYRVLGGIELMDVHNGYFIFPLSRILQAQELMLPVAISGVRSGGVIPIGSDDGLDYFVIQAAEPHHVLFLPEGLIEEGVYDNSRGKAKLVAANFEEFLERLLADVKAYVNQEADWAYMV